MRKLCAFLFLGLLICMVAAQSTRHGTGPADLVKKFINRLEESELELLGLNDFDDSSIEFDLRTNVMKIAGGIKNFTSKLALRHLSDLRSTTLADMVKNVTSKFVVKPALKHLRSDQLAKMINNFTARSRQRTLLDGNDGTELAKESDLELFGQKDIAVDNNTTRQSDGKLFKNRELPLDRASHKKSHGTGSQSTIHTKENGNTADDSGKEGCPFNELPKGPSGRLAGLLKGFVGKGHELFLVEKTGVINGNRTSAFHIANAVNAVTGKK